MGNPAKWTAGTPGFNTPRTRLVKSNGEAYLGTTIDNPPAVQKDDHSSIGRAVSFWGQSRRIPFDLARELMDEGFDLPALEAHHMKGSE
jgi:hypothetical protein